MILAGIFFRWSGIHSSIKLIDEILARWIMVFCKDNNFNFGSLVCFKVFLIGNSPKRNNIFKTVYTIPNQMGLFVKIYKFTGFFITFYVHPNMALITLRCMVVVCNCFVTYCKLIWLPLFFAVRGRLYKVREKKSEEKRKRKVNSNEREVL